MEMKILTKINFIGGSKMAIVFVEFEEIEM